MITRIITTLLILMLLMILRLLLCNDNSNNNNNNDNHSITTQSITIVRILTISQNFDLFRILTISHNSKYTIVLSKMWICYGKHCGYLLVKIVDMICSNCGYLLVRIVDMFLVKIVDMCSTNMWTFVDQHGGYLLIKIVDMLWSKVWICFGQNYEYFCFFFLRKIVYLEFWLLIRLLTISHQTSTPNFDQTSTPPVSKFGRRLLDIWMKHIVKSRFSIKCRPNFDTKLRPNFDQTSTPSVSKFGQIVDICWLTLWICVGQTYEYLLVKVVDIVLSKLWISVGQNCGYGLVNIVNICWSKLWILVKIVDIYLSKLWILFGQNFDVLLTNSLFRILTLSQNSDHESEFRLSQNIYYFDIFGNNNNIK